MVFYMVMFNQQMLELNLLYLREVVKRLVSMIQINYATFTPGQPRKRNVIFLKIE